MQNLVLTYRLTGFISVPPFLQKPSSPICSHGCSNTDMLSLCAWFRWILYSDLGNDAWSELVLPQDDSQWVGRPSEGSELMNLSILSSSLCPLLTWPLSNLSELYKLFLRVWYRLQGRAFLAPCSASAAFSRALTHPLQAFAQATLSAWNIPSVSFTWLTTPHPPRPFRGHLLQGAVLDLSPFSAHRDWEAFWMLPWTLFDFHTQSTYHAVLVSWPNSPNRPLERPSHIHSGFTTIQQSAWHTEDSQ